MADTRKDKRADVSLKVRYKSATVDEFIEQYAKDISRGGVFIKSKNPMPVGTLLKFEIQLKDESTLIHGVGRVVWKREAGEANDAPSGMGIKFIRMDPDCRALVDKIVTQRGDEPGQFDVGAEAHGVAVGDDKPATTVPTRKPTMQFFPSTGPTEAELPRPEDRTQVRHASEFLASALAEASGDSEAAREAERKAEEARRRTEEIERERAAQRAREAERERLEAEARERAEREKAEAEAREKAEREKAEAEAREKAEREKAEAEARERAEAEKAAAEKAAAEKAAAAAAAPTEKAASEKKDAPEKGAPKAAVTPPATDRPAPVEEQKSYLLPILVGVVAVAAIGGFLLTQGGGETSQSAPATATAPAPTAEPADEPAAPEDEGGEALAAEGDAVAEGEGAEGEGTEGAGEGEGDALAEGTAAEPAADEAPAAPLARFRVETTPPGATVLVDGVERGTSPLEIESPVGTGVSIAARLEGYRETTQQVTPTATQRPVRLTLAAMPYVLEVTTTPPGARVRAGARTATTAAGSASRLTLTRPSGPITVTATRTGYDDATTTVAPSAFVERDGEMVATISLALTARPVATTSSTGGGARQARPASDESGNGEAAGSSGGDSAGGSQPAAPRSESGDSAPAAGGSGDGASSGSGSSGSGSSESGSSRPAAGGGDDAPAPAPAPAPAAGGSSGGGRSDDSGGAAEAPPNPF